MSLQPHQAKLTAWVHRARARTGSLSSSPKDLSLQRAAGRTQAHEEGLAGEDMGLFVTESHETQVTRYQLYSWPHHGLLP